MCSSVSLSAWMWGKVKGCMSALASVTGLRTVEREVERSYPASVSDDLAAILAELLVEMWRWKSVRLLEWAWGSVLSWLSRPEARPH